MPSLSLSALFRAEKTAGTPLGLEVDTRTSQGKLASGMSADLLIFNWLGNNSLKSGAVFDACPRTLGHAEVLCEIFKKCERPLDFTFVLESRATVFHERMKARANYCYCTQISSIGVQVASLDSLCPGCARTLSRRHDAPVETLASRVREYEDKTLPLIRI